MGMFVFFRLTYGASAAQYEATLKKLYTVSAVEVSHSVSCYDYEGDTPWLLVVIF